MQHDGPPVIYECVAY